MKVGDRVVVTNPYSPYLGAEGVITRLRPRPTSDDALDVKLDGLKSSMLLQPYEVELKKP